VCLHLLLLLFIFLIHQDWQGRSGSLYLFMDNWLDPFLAVPMLVFLWQVEKQLIFQNRPLIPMTAMELGALTVLISLVSEGLFPLISRSFTFDVFDLLAFVTGSLYSWLFFRDPWRISYAERLAVESEMEDIQ
jgi:hypothetical protein